MSDKRKVVVTTEKRGVFFGTLESRQGGELVLLDARVCVYWSKATKGFLGLAKIGPQSGSRISPASPRLEVFGVTSISDCTDEAIKAWEAEPWS